MSVPTKKHRTRAVQTKGMIVVKVVNSRGGRKRTAMRGKASQMHGGSARRLSEQFIIPKSQVRFLRTFLNDLTWKSPASAKKEDTVPWRETLKARFAEGGGEPAVMLKSSREIAELTQLELAGKLGIPQSNVAHMESGRRAISKEMAKRLAEIFGVDYKVFL